MEQGRAHGLVVGADLGEDRGQGQRMADIGVAALAPLAFVAVRGDGTGAPDHRGIGAGSRAGQNP